MSDRDRQIAERMGQPFQGCMDRPTVAHEGKCDPKHADRVCGVRPFSPTTDANDREAAWDFLTAKGFSVVISYLTDLECEVKVFRTEGLSRRYFPEQRTHIDTEGPHYKGIAFGEAFLAATEEKA